ncbi:Annexin A11 [Hypsibius exemplaris]|uniref:Annexin n=1 Tax=Hypsibius exemplaris TaxID=2072580 RepID=A0A1W0WTK3_HYPEX|nr:Annexin A11 [Hypsibius exemplaris]
MTPPLGSLTRSDRKKVPPYTACKAPLEAGEICRSCKHLNRFLDDCAQKRFSVNPSDTHRQAHRATDMPTEQTKYGNSARHHGSIKALASFHDPTIVEFRSFNPDDDAKALHKAMKGFGTDEKAIINLLTKRSNYQRQIITDSYQALYNKDLLKDLKSELSGTLSEVVEGLMQSPDVFDANEIHRAVAGLGTDEEALIEILCSRSNAEIQALRAAYERLFKKDLRKDIEGDTSGYFRRLLIAELQVPRNEADEIFLYQAYHEALALWETGPKKWAQDEAFSIPIFTRRSHAHLRHVFDEYKKICGVDIEKDITNEMTGDVADFFLTIIKLSRNPPAYFAERLYRAMKGIGTNEKEVVRVIVSRSEKDLGAVKTEFAKLYGKSLESFISGDFSGDAKKILLALIGESPAK